MATIGYAKIEDLKVQLNLLRDNLLPTDDVVFRDYITKFIDDPKELHTSNVAVSELTTPIVNTALEKDTYKTMVSHFQNLLKDALYCNIEPNVIKSTATSDNNLNMNGLLKFVKAQANASAISANNVMVQAEIKTSNNTLH
jgi:hypothetical protein